MDYLEKIGDIITEKSREVTDKAKELAELAKLKSQISTCEDVIKKNHIEIGKLFMEQYGDDESAPFEKQREAIRNAQKGVADLQEKVKELKKKVP